MQHLPDDDRLLRRALSLAREAAAFASPNPAVGCVLSRDGQILAEGAHRYELRDHAEIVALKQASAAGTVVRGATAYVTLEPCSHHGRTGPCADALVAAGIARCVVATVDPNPLVSGQGLAKLRQGGVEVAVADPASGVAVEARRLNDAFAFSIQHQRPFVTLKAALSADGKLAPAVHTRAERAPHWLTGPAARADVHLLRHGADVLLTGIGTVLADDPALTDRTGQPRRRPLLRAVLDPRLRIPLASQLVRSAPAEGLQVFCDSDAPEEALAALEAAGVSVTRVGGHQGRLSLDLVLGHLGVSGMRSILLEAGPTLNGALLAHDLVDKVVLYRAPVTLGPGALPFAQPGPPVEHLLDRLSAPAEARFPRPGGAEDHKISGYLHDPWAGLATPADAIP